MKDSRLLDYLEREELYKEHSAAIEKDECGFRKQEEELKEELLPMLSAEGKEKLKYYSLSIENKSDAAHYSAKYKLLCVALKIGMEIQKSFDEELL